MAARFYYSAAQTGARTLLTGTEATIGPWSPKLQHGGPPCALLARAIEAEASKAGLPFVARLTVAFFRPVKVAARLEVEAVPIRVGSKVAHFEAKLFAVGGDNGGDDRVELLRATALSARSGSVGPLAPEPEAQRLVPPSPPTDAMEPMFKASQSFGYADHLETKCAKGTHGKGPTEMWCRVRHPLVEGEGPATPLQRALIWVDSAGGMSHYVNMHETSFVNADLTLNLIRPMQGEWCCMRARTDLSGPTGQGLASAELWDTEGFFGRVSQQQVLESRM
eukprot:CAMPEP_0174833912 /NCGR_PEP_ID=MMETSP1114-20130205/4523_1 /TAXON_ID=312471 /ORGANISM="Neobodo designis, Strain CCAP 1951/1" /LENGTH=278 /DNA_ID=CAMNT_0016067815 /DNA_START=59 /DNA_END=895 /DNA_ORIENTATION=-